MEEEELMKEILEIVHQVARHEFTFRHQKQAALIKVKDKILEFKGKDKALEQVVIYLNGFIQGLNH